MDKRNLEIGLDTLLAVILAFVLGGVLGYGLGVWPRAAAEPEPMAALAETTPLSTAAYTLTLTARVIVTDTTGLELGVRDVVGELYGQEDNGCWTLLNSGVSDAAGVLSLGYGAVLNRYRLILRGPDDFVVSRPFHEWALSEMPSDLRIDAYRLSETATPEPSATETETLEPTATDTAMPVPTDTETAMPTATDTATIMPTETATALPATTDTPVLFTMRVRAERPDGTAFFGYSAQIFVLENPWREIAHANVEADGIATLVFPRQYAGAVYRLHITIGAGQGYRLLAYVDQWLEAQLPVSVTLYVVPVVTALPTRMATP